MADRFRRPQQPNDTSSGSSRRDPLEQLRPIGSFFREHPAIVGSLLYLQVTTVSVLYSWQLFRHFNINVFDYAEANDFLLAAFKDPVVFASSIISVIFFIAFTGYWMVRMKRISESDPSPSSYTVPVYQMAGIVAVFTIGYTLLPPYFLAGIAADSLQSSSDEPLTSVQYRATSGSEEQTTEKGLRVIGTTQSFVFFYDRKESRNLIIPTAQIVEMQQSLKSASQRSQGSDGPEKTVKDASPGP